MVRQTGARLWSVAVVCYSALCRRTKSRIFSGATGEAEISACLSDEYFVNRPTILRFRLYTSFLQELENDRRLLCRPLSASSAILDPSDTLVPNKVNSICE
jgi:hypothetical protein